jgi:hypothetical protein
VALKTTPEPMPTWEELNNSLRDCDEAFARDLLAKATRAKWPVERRARIQKRFNKLRRAREMQELQSAK